MSDHQTIINNLQIELNETKQLLLNSLLNLASAEAEVDRLKSIISGRNNMMAAGLNACAEVVFIPKHT